MPTKLRNTSSRATPTSLTHHTPTHHSSLHLPARAVGYIDVLASINRLHSISENGTSSSSSNADKALIKNIAFVYQINLAGKALIKNIALDSVLAYPIPDRYIKWRWLRDQVATMEDVTADLEHSQLGLTGLSYPHQQNQFNVILHFALFGMIRP